jgi:5,10-methylenetetrahydrofolate reductase
MASLGPAAISVTWGAGGSTYDRSIDLAEFVAADLRRGENGEVSRKGAKGMECVLHLTCTNMPRVKVVEALDVGSSSTVFKGECMGGWKRGKLIGPDLRLIRLDFLCDQQKAKELGIKNILALRGGNS